VAETISKERDDRTMIEEVSDAHRKGAVTVLVPSVVIEAMTAPNVVHTMITINALVVDGVTPEIARSSAGRHTTTNSADRATATNEVVPIMEMLGESPSSAANDHPMLVVAALDALIVRDHMVSSAIVADGKGLTSAVRREALVVVHPVGQVVRPVALNEAAMVSSANDHMASAIRAIDNVMTRGVTIRAFEAV
jgi:hypothetical protein